ncbi:MAG: hypothetical protein GY800_11770 [Planctomycetes bacterium]|nr:hypothetical protein [Planctomycetota bacterium]
MSEEKKSNMDVEAILADEELIKKLAAKVLDHAQMKPNSDVPLRDIWNKNLNSLDMEIEKGLVESAAEYPINADEIDQVITEIRTSETYAEKLSGQDLERAVSKVLADNEMMRRNRLKVESVSSAYDYPYYGRGGATGGGATNGCSDGGGYYCSYIPQQPMPQLHELRKITEEVATEIMARYDSGSSASPPMFPVEKAYGVEGPGGGPQRSHTYMSTPVCSPYHAYGTEGPEGGAWGGCERYMQRPDVLRKIIKEIVTKILNRR